MCIFFYFYHTDRNHSIKSHIVTLTSFEKRMLIYVLDLFDGGGGGGAEAPKPPPPPLNPPLRMYIAAWLAKGGASERWEFWF